LRKDYQGKTGWQGGTLADSKYSVNKPGMAQAAYEQRKAGNFRNGGPLGIRPEGKNHKATACQIGEWEKMYRSVDRYKREIANLSAAL
jgi:hypothetical protein